jgi:3-methylcrotonyl-CoA carboxylase alpha subunit
MRKVDVAEDFTGALASCQREARSSFGNDVVLIEKYITSPRHIEVQVFGDTHGNVVHMFERDCSLQRRHQKVIEEVPAPGMTDDVRAAMTDAAVKAAKAVSYVGAGTVEFIVDGSGPLRTDGFWFMEMNTRLQVEHPVTEEITGLDLVELQIRVARGEKLPKQDEITMSGHAIEARLYAEDPANDFLPSTGHITYIDTKNYKFDDRKSVRIDTGVQTGSVVSIYYDPMIAKIIGVGPDREEAIAACVAGLSVSAVGNVKTNTQFLINCLGHDEFESGHVSTSFLQDYADTLIWPDIESLDAFYALAASHLFSGDKDQLTSLDGTANRPLQGLPAWRPNKAPKRSVDFMRGNEIVTASFVSDDGDQIDVDVNGAVHTVTIDKPTREHWKERLTCLSDWMFGTDESGVYVKGEIEYFAPFFTNQGFDSQDTSGNALTAPMPGKVISVSVAPGDAVTEGQTLLVLEAMKMEMAMKAPRDGVVAEVSAEAGALVNDGDVLVALEDE